MKIRALIVDDEPPARAKIRHFLNKREDVEVIGEAGDALEAIEQILELRPDLTFLDIQMPRGDGFDVLREVYPQHKPLVIFTTAFDQYAVRSFEVEALDYLLKPFTADRFHEAVDRAIRRSAPPSAIQHRFDRLLQKLSADPQRVPRLLIRERDRMFFLKANEIQWIEAEEKYVLLHTAKERHLIRQGISALETQLSGCGFVRIHRSYLINLEALKEVVPWSHGDSLAILKSGDRLNVGRNYKDQLLEAMGASAAGISNLD